MLKFDDIRSFVLKILQNFTSHINANYGMPSTITHRNTSLYDNYLPDQVLDDYEDSMKFSSNHRNNGMVAKSLIKAVEKIEN